MRADRNIDSRENVIPCDVIRPVSCSLSTCPFFVTTTTMPAIQAKSAAKSLYLEPMDILPSGLSRTLLERGYSVRGTVRTTEKGKHLLEIFKGYGTNWRLWSSRISPRCASVRDQIGEPLISIDSLEGAFDEAVKGVDAIAHTASPST